MSAQILDLCARLARPNWMRRPETWVWQGGSGMQGFGRNWRDNPGMSNLLWLAMDMDVAPAVYRANHNPLYIKIIMRGAACRLQGEPIFDVAAVTPLRVFRNMLFDVPEAQPGTLEAAFPLLRTLADRRLSHADA